MFYILVYFKYINSLILIPEIIESPPPKKVSILAVW